MTPNVTPKVIPKVTPRCPLVRVGRTGISVLTDRVCRADGFLEQATTGSAPNWRLADTHSIDLHRFGNTTFSVDVSLWHVSEQVGAEAAVDRYAQTH